MGLSDDSILPVGIEHIVDEVWHGERLEQQYNYLEYHFERDGAYCRARSYVDDFHKAVVFGPFEHRRSIRKVSSPRLERDTFAYLERRFRTVLPFGTS